MEFPPDFLAHLDGLPGFAREAFISVHSHHAAGTSVRLNPSKVSDSASLYFVDAQLQPLEANAAPVRIPWASHGYTLPRRPFFTYDPLFHAGGYYVQESSSMFLDHVLRNVTDTHIPLKALDLCGAPGGKSTLLLSVMHKRSLLVANETIRSRVPVLAENLTKWGADNVIITQNDPADFARLPHFFDILLVDAPCSGSGLFRKDPQAMEEWSLSGVSLCQKRQQRIIADAWPCLKPGGMLLYATCSYSRQEDEDLADWIMAEMDAETVGVPFDKDWGIIESWSPRYNAAGYRFWPHHVSGEGFYLACFRKKGDAVYTQQAFTHKQRRRLPSLEKEESLQSWLYAGNDLRLLAYKDVIRLFPAHLEEALLDVLGNQLQVVQFGIALGKPITDGLVPHAAFAFSHHLSAGTVRVPLNLEQSLHYLRRDEIILNEVEQVKGWALATYKNSGLGWMKLLRNRVNNYYPKEWRILKDPFH